LDSVVRDEPLTRLDLLKIDVEGGEMAVLRGAEESLARFRPTVMVELSEENCRAAGITARALVEFLVEKGYRLEAVRPDGTVSPLAQSQLPPFANLLCRPMPGRVVSIPGTD
jgi:hypothetical protein